MLFCSFFALQCKVAGRFDDKTTLELLDPNDPSKGLKMTYYGEPCSHKDKPARKFMIELACDRSRLSPVPVHAYEYKCVLCPRFCDIGLQISHVMPCSFASFAPGTASTP
jgi:hypothetical protein